MSAKAKSTKKNVSENQHIKIQTAEGWKRQREAEHQNQKKKKQKK